MGSETTFFSYARADSDFALKLAKDLREKGVNIWLDQLDIKGGHHWDASIEIALEASVGMIVILSPKSIASNNVMDEVSYALESGKKVIPVLLNECTPPFRLRRLQRIDFTRDYQTGFNQLLEALDHTVADDKKNNIKEPEQEKPQASEPDISHVKQKQQQEQDNELWEEACRLNIVSSYKKYINDTISGLHKEKAQQLIEQLESGQNENENEKRLWEKVKSENAISSYNNYLQEYPQGKNTEDAINAIKKIKETEKQKQETFLEKERAILAEQESELWTEACNLNTVSSYNKYNNETKSGEHKEKAKQLIAQLDLAQKEKQHEIRFWEKVKSENTINSYDNYLDKYPDGIYKAEASRGRLNCVLMDEKEKLTSNDEIERNENQQKSIHPKKEILIEEQLPLKSQTKYLLIAAGVILLGVVVWRVVLNNSHNSENKQTSKATTAVIDSLPDFADRFADIQVLRYSVPGFEELTLKQKQLAYYLYMAGMSGRDIYYDQKYKHNLRIRKTLENILTTYSGDKNSDDFKKFLTYCKRFFFANGIHHHYSSAKMLPEFSFEYFKLLIKGSDQSNLPLDGMKMDDYLLLLQKAVFDPNTDKKCTDLSSNVDNVKASANNFYENVTQKEVEDFYSKLSKPGAIDEPSWGLNSKLKKENGKVVEKTWKVGGMYDLAIQRMVNWLEKAAAVAENETQKRTLELLIQYYKTGDLKVFDEYCISWVSDTVSMLDISTGFVEVYMDPLYKKGSYEAVVSMKDLEATKRIATIAREAQWFEDNSPLMEKHKKKNVKGISAKVITVIGEAGDAAPATPIGINLPNAEWIRENHGSKSVSLGNIVDAYNYARSKSPMIDEFGYSKEVIDRYKKYAGLAGDLHTDMHEVIGHASGQINAGVATTDITLKNYASTLEEARADLVALYYVMDQKLVDIGVMPTLDVGKAEYDYYIMNGIMTQLYRIQPGDNIEESHMRNRQLVASWAFEHGKKENVIKKTIRDGKTYFVIDDYNKLRVLFGELLREIQRIKSEGDFKVGQRLVVTYGVKADQELLKEVHARYDKLNIAPYMGFIQPKLIPVMNGDSVSDVKIEYANDFIKQMLEFGKEFSFLPVKN